MYSLSMIGARAVIALSRYEVCFDTRLAVVEVNDSGTFDFSSSSS